MSQPSRTEGAAQPSLHNRRCSEGPVPLMATHQALEDQDVRFVPHPTVQGTEWSEQEKKPMRLPPRMLKQPQQPLPCGLPRLPSLAQQLQPYNLMTIPLPVKVSHQSPGVWRHGEDLISPMANQLSSPLRDPRTTQIRSKLNKLTRPLPDQAAAQLMPSTSSHSSHAFPKIAAQQVSSHQYVLPPITARGATRGKHTFLPQQQKLPHLPRQLPRFPLQQKKPQLSQKQFNYTLKYVGRAAQITQEPQSSPSCEGKLSKVTLMKIMIRNQKEMKPASTEIRSSQPKLSMFLVPPSIQPQSVYKPRSPVAQPKFASPARQRKFALPVTKSMYSSPRTQPMHPNPINKPKHSSPRTKLKDYCYIMQPMVSSPAAQLKVSYPVVKPKVSPPVARPKVWSIEEKPKVSPLATQPKGSHSAVQPKVSPPAAQTNVSYLEAQPKVSPPEANLKMLLPSAKTKVSLPSAQPKISPEVAQPKVSAPAAQPTVAYPEAQPKISPPVAQPKFSHPTGQPTVSPRAVKPKGSPQAAQPRVSHQEAKLKVLLPTAKPKVSLPPAQPMVSSPAAQLKVSSPAVQPGVTHPAIQPEVEPVVSSANVGKGQRTSPKEKKSPPHKIVFPLSSLAVPMELLNRQEIKELKSVSTVWYLGTGARRSVCPGPRNDGYDDKDGFYIPVLHEQIQFRYEVIQNLGIGSYGFVLKCMDHKTKEMMAIKIVRNLYLAQDGMTTEEKILNHLHRKDPEGKRHVICIKDSFVFRGHKCLCFELGGQNLYEAVCMTKNALTMKTLRSYTWALLKCLDFLKAEDISHSDLKPDNIVIMRNSIKVIDFGLSSYGESLRSSHWQMRWYRAPEIIMGLSSGSPMDMWSLGCTLAELHTRKILFQGKSNTQQLALIMQVLGVPPLSMITACQLKSHFFDVNNKPLDVLDCRKNLVIPGSIKLKARLNTNNDMFVAFIQKCLFWDPKRRMTPAQAMQHPWFHIRSTRTEWR